MRPSRTLKNFDWKLTLEVLVVLVMALNKAWIEFRGEWEEHFGDSFFRPGP